MSDGPLRSGMTQESFRDNLHRFLVCDHEVDEALPMSFVSDLTPNLKVARICNLNSFHTSHSFPGISTQPSRKRLSAQRQIHSFRTIKRFPRRSHLFTKQNIFTSSNIMGSDEDYSSFLDKANQDTGADKATTQSKKASTKAVDTSVPKSLEEVEEYYVSEADEPFEPVSLKWDGDDLPSDSTSAFLNTKVFSNANILNPRGLQQFDRKGCIEHQSERI
jgi:hypothetical protein